MKLQTVLLMALTVLWVQLTVLFAGKNNTVTPTIILFLSLTALFVA